MWVRFNQLVQCCELIVEAAGEERGWRAGLSQLGTTEVRRSSGCPEKLHMINVMAAKLLRSPLLQKEVASINEAKY